MENLSFYLRRFNTATNVWDYAYINAGIVTYSVTEKALKDNPIGWRDANITWRRNSTYPGIIRTQTNPLQFIGDGARILLYTSLFEGGTEAQLQLLIKKRNTELGGDWSFYDYCASDIDFSNLKVSDKGETVTVNLLEGGLYSLLKAYENTTFEIPIQDNDCTVVYLDGHSLRTFYEFQGGLSTGFTFNANDKITPNLTKINFESGDFFANIIKPGTQTLQVVTTSTFSQANNTNNHSNFMEVYNADINIDLKLEADVIVHPVSVAQPVEFRFMIIKLPFGGGGTFFFSTIFTYGGIGTPISINNGSTVSFHASVDIPQFPFEKDCAYLLVYTAEHSGIPSNGEDVQIVVENLTFTLDGYNKLPDSLVKGYKWFEVFSKLTDKMTNGAYQANSAYCTNSSGSSFTLGSNVDSTPYRELITCGDALRSLGSTTNPPRIKISIANMQKDITSRYDVGIGVENEQLVIKELRDYYKANVLIADLGTNISGFEWDFATEYMGSTLEIGYENQDYGELNGRDEYNTKRIFRMPFTRVTEKIDMVSPFRADMFGIEQTRANLINKDTTDGDSDNDVFLISYDPGATTVGPAGIGQQLYRGPNFATVSGVISPSTAYNIPLTPGRNLRRKGRYFKTLLSMLKAADRFIYYTSTDKNPDLVSAYWALPVTESDNIAVSILPGAIYFYPIAFTFNAILPHDFAEKMDADPYGVIRFTINNLTLEGFVIEVGENIAIPNESKVTLLASPNTNLTDFYNMLLNNI